MWKGLNITVRKGFPEKVTFEQKPNVGEGMNHKGEKHSGNMKTKGKSPGVDWSWVRGQSGALWLEQSKEASKTGSREAYQDVKEGVWKMTEGWGVIIRALAFTLLSEVGNHWGFELRGDWI